MKKLAKLAAVVGLTLSFGMVALGGETSTPPGPPPAPGEQSSTGAAPFMGDDSQADYVTEATLELFQSVLSLL